MTATSTLVRATARARGWECHLGGFPDAYVKGDREVTAYFDGAGRFNRAFADKVGAVRRHFKNRDELLLELNS